MSRKTSVPLVRLLSMLVMVLGLASMTAVSASAAPGGAEASRNASFQVPGLTFDVCDTLDLDDSGTVDLGEAGPLAVDLDGDGDVDIDDQTIAVDECTAILAAGPGGVTLTAEICAVLDVDDSGTVDDIEADALGVDLTGDGVIDEADQAIAVADCTALLAEVPPPGEGLLTVEICTALDVNGDGVVDADEAASLGVDLDGNGIVDADDQAIAIINCDELLAPAPGPTEPADGTDATDGTDAVDGTDGTDGEPGSVVISKFVCTQIEEPTATISDPVGVGALGPDDEEGCSVDSANFEIYLNSDFTSDPIEVFVEGTATVDGIPENAGGVAHALFEPQFNVFFEFFVEPGGVTTITVLNPADDGDGATPVGDDSDAGDGVADDGTGDGTGDDGVADDGTGDDGTGDDAADDGATGDDDGAAAEDEDEDTDVSGLPSTGQGSDGGASGSALVLLFGAVSMVALAGGFAWRQRQTR